MDGEAPIVSKKRMRLDLPPSCLQFCPVDPAYFVVGTYNLQAENSQRTTPPDAEGNQVDVARKQQNRNGSLILFRLDDRDMLVLLCLFVPLSVFWALHQFFPCL